MKKARALYPSDSLSRGVREAFFLSQVKILAEEKCYFALSQVKILAS
jgi:hypothetical protein